MEILKLPTPHGDIEVRFTLEFHGSSVTDIENLSISAHFELPYKTHPFIVVVGNKYKLFRKATAKENGQDIEVHVYYDDELSDKIAEAVGARKEEATFRFTP